MYRPTISYRDFMCQLPVGSFKIIFKIRDLKDLFWGRSLLRIGRVMIQKVKGYPSQIEEYPFYTESKAKSQRHLQPQDLFVLALCQRKLGRLH
jgi:hypothetical protein